MIVSCPGCSTKYKLNLASVEENGQKVRCTKCGHIWIHSNKKSTKDSGIKVDISRNLPVVIDYVVPTWFKLVPVVLVFLIISTIFFFFQENFGDRSRTWRNIYSSIGLPYNRSLVIEKFKVNKLEDNSLDVDVSLVNRSGETRRLPGLIVRAIDIHNKNIGNFYIDPNVNHIVDGGEYHFFQKIDNFPSDTKLVVAELQNKFDWISRRN